MIKLDDWAEIRHLHSTGKHSKREIARLVGVSRGTVDRALAVDRSPTYQREPTGSSFDAFAGQVRVLLAATPTMPAATAAERVGWSGSPSLFRAKIAELRPEYAVPDPADRLVHPPGFQVQCDLWFPHEDLPLGHDQAAAPPVLVMTSTFSGFIQARMLPSRTTPDLLGGMWSLLQEAEAVPARLTWDNETGIGRGKLTDPAAAFAGTLGTQIKLLKARDPESKGMVERMNRFFRSRFMSGRAFTSPDDFNQQLAGWLPIANNRLSRSRRGRPQDLVRIDRAAMRGLPPMAPEVMFRNSVRLPRDYYVRAFSNDYSVDPAMIGRVVDVAASLERVTVHHDGVLIANHRRKWARQLTVTDPAHVLRAAELRAQFQAQRARRPAVTAVVEMASLARYDELFSVDIDAAPTVLAVAS
ncbi:helix-turn-helix domain-containing protein [Cryobacterium sp. GrIS_2_6]|uniref:Mu transposase domain-containing protein n=1 Tax=Cryobacterium sp. GrIS_2_6 TaxID=3162785 RepID=UPI002E0F02CB|nr:helix-turn-helix domain-containing protein [Cryobacterium psychrotolerans]